MRKRLLAIILFGRIRKLICGFAIVLVGGFLVTSDVYASDGAKLYEVSLNLSGKIGINFYMDLPVDVFKVRIEDVHGEYVEYPVSEVYKKGSKYCYTYFVAAKESADLITVSAFDTYDNLVPFTNSSAVNGKISYSVKDYLDSVLDPAKGYQQSNLGLYNLCQGLDEYSLSTRYYLGYNAHEVDASSLNGLLGDFSAYEPVITGFGTDVAGLSYLGTSLILDSDTGIRHYFKPANGDGNYKFILVDGGNSWELNPTMKEGYLFVDICNIPAAKLADSYDLKVYCLKADDVNNTSPDYNDEADLLVGQIKYSALSYGQRAMLKYGLNSADVPLALAALCNGLKSYGGAASEYWSTIEKAYEKSVLNIKLSDVCLDMAVDEQKTISATCLPLDSINFGVTWTSSDPSVAVVVPVGGTGTINPGETDLANHDDSDKAKSATYNYNSGSNQVFGQITALKPGKALIMAETPSGVWAQCLVTVGNGGRPVLGDNYLDVTEYINRGGSPTDAFNDAIQALTDECNTLYVPAGNYALNACNMVTLKSNINIIMDENAIIDVKANEADGYNMFYGENVGNVSICGGKIIGERYKHKDTKGEWGMGIGLYSCENISIYDMEIDYCWGDGIYIGSSDNKSKCKNINIINCKLENNRRNDMSIVAGDNILIDGCIFSKAEGTDPQNGLDIEPNYLEQVCTDISIFNSKFYGSKIAGMTMANVTYSIELCEAAKHVDIVGCTFEDGLWNYGGSDAQISDTVVGDYLHWPDDSMIGDNIHWRSGIAVGDNVHINDGTSEPDELVAYYCAEDGANLWHTFGTSNSNVIICQAQKGTDDGGINCVRFIRPSSGNANCGCYINLFDISLDGSMSLETGKQYRFEYVLKGTGEWGTQTSQSDWYFCSPKPDKYRTYMTTQYAKSGGNMQFSFITNGTGAGMYIDLVELRIYKVN